MSTQVVTVCNRIPDRNRESYYRFDLFMESLSRFGVTPTILGMGEWWGGLMTKPRRLRQWLREGQCEADTLIVCDAFDIVFTAHPDEVGEEFHSVHGKSIIVFNAEKGLFPRADLAHAFPERLMLGPGVPSPWRYLNSGFFIGPPALILQLLESMNLDDIHDDHRAQDALHGGEGRMVEPNDQGFYQLAYAARLVPMDLDAHCVLCQTGSACEMEEFDLSGDKVRNVVTNTKPLVWHFNGSSKDLLLPTFAKKWGLE